MIRFSETAISVIVLTAACRSAPEQVKSDPAETVIPRPAASAAQPSAAASPAPSHPEEAWRVKTEDDVIAIMQKCKGYRTWKAPSGGWKLTVRAAASPTTPVWVVAVNGAIDTCNVNALTGNVLCEGSYCAP